MKYLLLGVVAYICYRIHHRPAEFAALMRRKGELLHALEHAARMHKLAVEIAEYKRDPTTPFLLAYYASVVTKLDDALTAHNADVKRFCNPVLWLLTRPIR